MKERLRIPLTNIIIGRFGLLFISILLMFILRPFMEGYIGLQALLAIFMSAIVISVIYAVSEQKRVFMIVLVIAIPTLIIKWLNYFVQSSAIYLASDVIGGVFCAYVTTIILSYVYSEKKIAVDFIYAAVSGYFLIGLMWAFIFSALEFLMPGSFQGPQVEASRLSHAYYYSFTTLTTLGYGDITPVSAPARSFSFLEAIMGQLYLAILIAGLVGKYIVQSIEGNHTSKKQ
jgi:voltage-gated potassium channel